MGATDPIGLINLTKLTYGHSKWIAKSKNTSRGQQRGRRRHYVRLRQGAGVEPMERAGLKPCYSEMDRSQTADDVHLRLLVEKAEDALERYWATVASTDRLIRIGVDQCLSDKRAGLDGT